LARTPVLFELEPTSAVTYCNGALFRRHLAMHPARFEYAHLPDCGCFAWYDHLHLFRCGWKVSHESEPSNSCWNRRGGLDALRDPWMQGRHDTTRKEVQQVHVFDHLVGTLPCRVCGRWLHLQLGALPRCGKG